MKLIIGLGNIGDEFADTRHNIGFMVVDELARQKDLKWTHKAKFRAMIAEYKNEDGEKIILAKPTTFYNLTGVVAQTIGDFYNINFGRDLLVVHDDLAIDFGTIKMRTAGSYGGNKGIRSIIDSVGPQFRRIKIGTKNDQLELVTRTEFVLRHFSKEELNRLEEIMPELGRLIDTFIEENFTDTKIIF